MGLLYDKFLLVLFFTLFVLHGCVGQTEDDYLDRDGTQQHTNSDSLSRTFTDTSLVTIMRKIGVNTNKFFTILGVNNTFKINAYLKRTLLEEYPNYCEDNSEESSTTDDLVINCKWNTYGNTQVLTVKTRPPRDPNYISLAVHSDGMELSDPLESIKDVCNKHFTVTQSPTTSPTTTRSSHTLRPTLTCPNVTCDNLFEKCDWINAPRVCTECASWCPNLETIETMTPYETTTSENKGTYDASKDNCSQSGGVDTIPIVIASIASFIAGIVACLLVLCLLRHCRKRPCFKSSTSEDGSSKPKQHQETYEGLQAQSKGKNIPEYIGLQDVNPKIRTELGAKRPQPSAPQQAIVYETSDKRRSEHVYSELGNKPTNGPGEYESTYPNRSSNHVYQGIQGNTNPNIPSRHQTNELPVNKRGNKGHINGAMGQDRDPISETDGADSCYSQKHDYFVLEKENHKPNESEMSAGTKSDGQGRLNDSLQSEPDDKNTEHNEYFVLEKENKAVNEVERVEDIKIDDTHLEADDDVDDDYHSYHVLEKQ